jgi:hypothetical protein
VGLWILSGVGSCCDFLTLIYIGKASLAFEPVNVESPGLIELGIANSCADAPHGADLVRQVPGQGGPLCWKGAHRGPQAVRGAGCQGPKQDPQRSGETKEAELDRGGCRGLGCMNDGAFVVSSFHGICVCWPATCCSTRVPFVTTFVGYAGGC